MKECLEQIGVICNVKPTEFVVMQDKLLKHEFEAASAAGAPAPTPTCSANIYATGAQRNYGQYSNPKVDELFDQGRREFDPRQSGPRSTAKFTCSCGKISP